MPYVGGTPVVTQVDGYNRSEANSRFPNQLITTVAGATYTMLATDGELVVTATTSTITIPAGLDLASVKTIRKVGSAGTVTINFSGSERATRAALASITLSSDGDFWTIKKVTATRWELVDGFETISGTNDGIKRHDGTMEQWGIAADGAASETITFTPAFSDIPKIRAMIVEGYSSAQYTFFGVFSDLPSSSSVIIRTKVYDNNSNSFLDASGERADWHAIGRWYA